MGGCKLAYLIQLLRGNFSVKISECTEKVARFEKRYTNSLKIQRIVSASTFSRAGLGPEGLPNNVLMNSRVVDRGRFSVKKHGTQLAMSGAARLTKVGLHVYIS